MIGKVRSGFPNGSARTRILKSAMVIQRDPIALWRRPALFRVFAETLVDPAAAVMAPPHLADDDMPADRAPRQQHGPDVPQLRPVGRRAEIAGGVAGSGEEVLHAIRGSVLASAKGMRCCSWQNRRGNFSPALT